MLPVGCVVSLLLLTSTRLRHESRCSRWTNQHLMQIELSQHLKVVRAQSDVCKLLILFHQKSKDIQFKTI